MDHPQAKETTCKHCNEVFPSKGKYQAHYRRYHQNEVKMQGTLPLYRSENEQFICICQKGYYSVQSLHHHQKSCHQWKDHETSVGSDSDLEMSVQGNIHLHFISFNL